MDKEEAISVIENEIQIDVRLCTDEQVERFQTALYMAISALRAMHTDHFPDLTKMVPLTLWELEDMEGQKVLLYRMKSTEPLEPGTVKKYGDVLGDVGMLAYHELYLETWVAFSYQAQEKPDFDKPLTLEQLWEMDGQPVWVKVIGKTGIRCDGWCEVEIREKDPFAYVWWPGSEVEDIAKIEDYRKEWLAYAYPPVHIDRGAWRCPICSGNEVIEFKAWKTPEQIINGPFAQGGAMFCPRCGKPRTPEACAELKKRLRG